MGKVTKAADERDLQLKNLQVDHALLQERFEETKRQLDWFKRELFGPKSERREIPPDQLALFESMLENFPPAPEQSTQVPAHTRRKKRSDNDVNDTGLRFTDEVPIEVVELSVPELNGPDADDYTIIDYRESYRLASEPGTHVVICYRRPVVARKDGSGVVEAGGSLRPCHSRCEFSRANAGR